MKIPKLKLSNPKMIVLALLVLAIVIVSLTPTIESRIRVTASYPATVCPANFSDGNITAVLPNSKIGVRSIPSKSGKLIVARRNLISNGDRPLFVDGSQSTSISVTKSGTGWLATSLCGISSEDQWFVGGSGSLTSKAGFEIVNSGLSQSIVDLFIFTSKGPQPISSQSIAANSVKFVPIDSLAPGEDSVVVHAVTRSGRVSTFLLDQRKKGLRSLGADFVSAGSMPAKHIVIPAVDNSVGATTTKKTKKGRTVSTVGNSADSTLRLLAPGNIDANIKVTVFSTDGTFSPLGLDGKLIKNGGVIDLPFSPTLTSKAYSVVIDSDQPIVAGIRTVAKGEFAWSSTALQFDRASLNFGGLRPTALFQGSAISVDVEYILSNGKSGSQRISGEGAVTWKPAKGLSRATFTNLSGSYGAIIFSDDGGIATLPIASGAALESAAVPIADARVISRH